MGKYYFERARQTNMPSLTRRMAMEQALGPLTQPRGHASLPEAPASMSRHQTQWNWIQVYRATMLHSCPIRSDRGTSPLKVFLDQNDSGAHDFASELMYFTQRVEYIGFQKYVLSNFLVYDYFSMIIFLMLEIVFLAKNTLNIFEKMYSQMR